MHIKNETHLKIKGYNYHFHIRHFSFRKIIIVTQDNIRDLRKAEDIYQIIVLSR